MAEKILTSHIHVLKIHSATPDVTPEKLAISFSLIITT